MSLFCSISGQQPLQPVVSIKSGLVYEKDLVLKYINENSKDPTTGEPLSAEDLIAIKTAPSAPGAPPRPPTFTSVPALLHTLQNEWDSTMLELLEQRRITAELKQELSHALYKEDASLRVLARFKKERDEARQALASVKATLGGSYEEPAAAVGGDVEMEEGAPAPAGLPADAAKRVADSHAALSATRRKRKPPPGSATTEEVKAYVQTAAIPSLHGTKPPGLSALDVAKDGELVLTGGLDKAVQVYDRSTSKILVTLKGHTKKVTAAVFVQTLGEDGLPTHIISASQDKSVRVWTPSAGKTAYSLAANLSTPDEVTGLSLHASGTLVASASADGTVSIHDLVAEGGKPATIFTTKLAGGAGASCIAFHPDGNLFAVGSTEAAVHIYDTTTGQHMAALQSEGADKAINSLSFSENGYILASASTGAGDIKIWDLRKTALSATIKLEEGISVSAVAFDYSAQFLAAAGSDLRVFANKTWDLLVKSDENGAELTGLAWAKGGKELYTAGIDRTVRVVSGPAAE